MSGLANPLEQSDEEFLNQSGPPAQEAVEETEVEETSEDEGTEEDTGSDAGESKADTEGDLSDEEFSESKAAPDAGNAEGDASDDGASAAGDTGADGDKDPIADGTAEKDKDPVAKDGDKKADPSGSEDDGAESARFVVPTEFVANGKTIKLKDENEALQLMQMGANYTKRMQDLAPHRKTLLMLQNNQIDEDKLSFLIDLERKDPEAIKKLILDAGIDPMDIDTSVDPKYSPGSHRVTDEQERFRTAVDEVKSLPAGKDTILAVTQWDQASKDAMWENPEILSTIHQQRELGVYDLISTEIDRRRTLGIIPVGAPFLEAYKNVGMEMAEEANRAKGSDGSAEHGVAEPAPASARKSVTTRVAEPKSSVANGDKAKAASPSKATPSTAKAIVNVLAQSDDEFLKQMEGRV